MLAALAATVPASTAPWACAALQSFECPEVDEMRQEPGCQVRCRGASCPHHGPRAVRKLKGCDDFAVNDERTWATLKQRRTRRAKAELECPNHDELPDEPGCQLACRGGRACGRARGMCKRVPRCGDVELNAARTWATLKRLAENTSAAVAAAAAAAGGGARRSARRGARPRWRRSATAAAASTSRRCAPSSPTWRRAGR